MSRRAIALLVVYPLALSLITLFVGISIASRKANAIAFAPGATRPDSKVARTFGEPKACVLAFLDAQGELAQLRLRIAGGEQVRPLLASSFYGGWSKGFATISSREVLGSQQTGPDKTNVKVKLLRTNNADPQTLTFVVERDPDSKTYVISEIRETCSLCDGTGMRKCYECGGTGTKQAIVEDKNEYGYVIGRRYANQACYACDGKGKVRCQLCKKRGYICRAPDLATEYDPDKNAVVFSSGDY